MTEEELRQKEIELERREQALEYRERKVDETKQQMSKAKPPPNWPKWRPLIYHDIQAEIPEKSRNITKRVYFAWMLTVFTYLVNVVGTLAGLIGTGNGGTSFGIALAFFLVGTPVAFVFWYRPFYRATKGNSSFYYLTFFFCFAFHCAFIIVLTVGIPNSGGGGWIYAFSTLGSNVGAGIVLLISSVVWTLDSLFCSFQLIAAWRHYRSSGASAEKAAAEAATAAASSSAGQAAIKSAARGAAQSAADNV